MIVVYLIFLNLFIAIILESFNTSLAEDDLQINQFTVNEFNKHWSRFDPDGKGFIPVVSFQKFIQKIVDEEIR